jgi:hypothetical protein
MLLFFCFFILFGQGLLLYIPIYWWLCRAFPHTQKVPWDSMTLYGFPTGNFQKLPWDSVNFLFKEVSCSMGFILKFHEVP